jgi:3-phenylpropionate/trans-cinnamate dioxygenase ferredoxin reductase subunit
VKRIVLVGGGPAAVSAAATLRAEGYDGKITLATADPELPYERPPLSKEFLTAAPGASPTGDIPYLRPPQWYAEQDITVLLGATATMLDPQRRRLRLDYKSVLDYDAVLLATGVRPKTAISSNERIVALRTAADARRLRDRLAETRQIVVLGGGFIGCEVAATAISMGKRVVLLERAGGLMQRALGADLGSVLTDVHRAKGVELKLGAVVVDHLETTDRIILRTSAGSVEGDLVVVGAGCEPNDHIAAAAGIATGNGILTDGLCRTNAPEVYAAGDVASSFHPFYGQHLRVEHHDWAQRQGATAARAMLGAGTPCAEPHWFWSDQYENNIQQAGRSEPGDQFVLRGSVDDLSFSGVWLRDDRITRVVAVNRPRDVVAVRKLLFSDHSVRPEFIADADNDLRQLTRPARIA